VLTDVRGSVYLKEYKNGRNYEFLMSEPEYIHRKMAWSIFFVIYKTVINGPEFRGESVSNFAQNQHKKLIYIQCVVMGTMHSIRCANDVKSIKLNYKSNKI